MRPEFVEGVAKQFPDDYNPFMRFYIVDKTIGSSGWLRPPRQNFTSEPFGGHVAAGPRTRREATTTTATATEFHLETILRQS